MSAFDYTHIRFERRGHVALATLDRPETLNALNQGLRDDITSLADDVRDDDDVRVLVLTGAGRGFCSGADLSSGSLNGVDATQNDRIDELEGAGRRALALAALDKPIIGAINGVCAGAGMSLALSCDVRVGGPATRFRTTFVDRGLSPDSAMSYYLPRIIGHSRAADLLFTSRDVDSAEAYRLGLIDRFVDEQDALVEEAVSLAAGIASKPPLAVRSSKRVLQHNIDAVLLEALRYENAGLNFAKRAVEDSKEAIASFREKRSPTYTGR